MKSKNISIYLIGITIALFYNCKKSSSSSTAPTPTPPATSVITDVFSSQGVTAQTSTAYAATSQTVACANNASFMYNSNSFVTQSNGTVTGSFQLSVTEIFTKKDMILSGAPTNGSNGTLVAIKVAVKVKATQNGQVLRVAPGSNTHWQISAGSTPNYTLNTFVASNLNIADTGSYFTQTASNNISIVLDTASSSYKYNLVLDSSSWTCFGSVWDTTSSHTFVTINVPSNFNQNNCAVYLSVNGVPVVAALHELSPHAYMITNIPVGINVNFVAVGIISGQYYSAILPATITSNYTNTLNLQATTTNQLQSTLSVLP